MVGLLAFCEWGDPDGAPLFFLHGSPGSCLSRCLVNGEYERHAIHAITYDRPGYGLSSRQPRHGVADAAGDVQSIADHLGLAEFAVVGVWGGRPVRPRDGGRASGPGHPLRDDRQCGAPGRHRSGLRGEHVRGGDRRFRADQQGVEPDHDVLSRKVQGVIDWVQTVPDMPERIKAMLTEVFEAAIAPGSWASSSTTTGTALAHPWAITLGAIGCPVTILAAQDDVTSTTHGQWLADHVPSANLITVPVRSLRATRGTRRETSGLGGACYRRRVIQLGHQTGGLTDTADRSGPAFSKGSAVLVPGLWGNPGDWYLVKGNSWTTPGYASAFRTCHPTGSRRLA